MMIATVLIDPPVAATLITSGATSRETRLTTLIIGLRAGPAVSLSGSPTVSPITLALWRSENFTGVVRGIRRFVLDLFFGIIPGAARVGHKDRQQLAGNDDACQEAAQGPHTDQESRR